MSADVCTQETAQFRFMRARFGLKSRSGLYERIAAFLEANIDIVSTLRAIGDRYRLRKDYRYMIIGAWIAQMEKGVSFSEAIKWWLPPSEHMLIAAGARGEGLIHGLNEAVAMCNAFSRFHRDAIIGGLAVPAVFFTVIIGLLTLLHVQMAPALESLLPVDALTAVHAGLVSPEGVEPLPGRLDGARRMFD